MLNVNEIAARIENPSITKAQDSEDLKSLSEKYPYTQLFSILYLQSLKQAGDIHFEDELKKHSYRITDRAQLFNLIESSHAVSDKVTPKIEEERVEETIETVEEDNKEQAPISAIKLEAEELTSPEEIVEAEPTREKEEIVTKEIVEEIETPILEEESTQLDEVELVVDTPEIEPKNDDIEETIFDSNDTEEQELYSIDQAFKDDNEVENDSKDPLEQTIAHHIYAANYQLDSLSPEEEERLKEKETQNQKKTSVESEIKEDLSFTSWLQANDNYIEPEEEVVSVKVVPEFSNFDPSNPLFGEQERPKQEFFSAPKKAKKSLTEETVPVSETLAKVYEMQGNYPKAIAAYEQLMLTIPEKKEFLCKPN